MYGPFDGMYIFSYFAHNKDNGAITLHKLQNSEKRYAKDKKKTIDMERNM